MISDNMTTGRIFNIQRYSLHDGAGIRTLVFLKGCPLRCKWCSNPESHRLEFEIGFIRSECLRCGACLAVCDAKAISLPDYIIDRSRCTDCLKCADVCQVGAKKIIGKDMTVSEVMDIIEKDRVFYKNSNGGVTVGGGEPALQSHFVYQLLQVCKARNIGTSVETCGHAPFDAMERIAEYADLVFCDIKHLDNDVHKQITGVENNQILENVLRLGQYKKIVVRVPLIPDLNDDEENIRETLAFAAKIEQLVEVEFLYYHNLGISKYNMLGRSYMGDEIQIYSKEQKDELKKRIKNNRGAVLVRID